MEGLWNPNHCYMEGTSKAQHFTCGAKYHKATHSIKSKSNTSLQTLNPRLNSKSTISKSDKRATLGSPKTGSRSMEWLFKNKYALFYEGISCLIHAVNYTFIVSLKHQIIFFNYLLFQPCLNSPAIFSAIHLFCRKVTQQDHKTLTHGSDPERRA